MEILLAFAVAFVGIACLVIAANFRKRTIKYSTPGIEKVGQELTNHIKQFKRIRDEAEDMRVSAENATAKLEGRINELAARQQENVRQADRLRTLINALQKTVGNAQFEFQNVVTGIQQAQSGIVSDLQSVHASITQLEARDDRAKAATDQLGQQIADIRASLNSLSGRVDSTKSSISGLQDGLTASKQEVGRLHEVDQELRKRLIYGLYEIASTQQELDDIKLFIRHELEYERTAAPAPSLSRMILFGSLYSDMSSAQIVWHLCRIFWSTLSMELLFHYSTKSTTCFYLMQDSPDGQSVEECMEELFRNCQKEHEEITGLEEFNGVLQALYDGKPAALRMGSAVITWNGNELLAGIIADEKTDTDNSTLLEPKTYATRLRQPDTRFFVDLTAWARDYGL